MTLALERGLAMVERLIEWPDGAPLSALKDDLQLPAGACHRILQALVRLGYVRQPLANGPYLATAKVASLGLVYLSGTGIVDIADPLLERLAQASRELVRLSIVDVDRLTWVSKVQGSRRGARYDPDMGTDARLSCTASGHAWLLTLTDEQALHLVTRQGFGQPRDYGPNAPTTVKALLGFLHAARVRGYAMIDEVFAPGMSAMAAPVKHKGRTTGVISIAGPRTRLTRDRMHALAPALLDAASELGPLSVRATLYGKPPLGKA